MAGRVRAYLGMSLDGRIAGPDDELDWLEQRPARQAPSLPPAVDGYVTYEAFTADVGAICMGRRTFDVVSGFDEWFYGDLPVVVATSRPLPDDAPSTVTAASGSIAAVLAAAGTVAGDRDVYVDGGRLVSAALAAGLLDELVTTVVATVRGPGVGLFDALDGPHDLDLVDVATDGTGMVQLTWRPHRP